MVLNGAGLILDGVLVAEGNPLPASVGGLELENWDNFDFTGITNAGDYAFTGDTDGDTATDEFVVYNGEIIYREGDTLDDGFVLAGSIEAFALSSRGDMAMVWDVEDGLGGDVEALIFNGRVLLKEGDPIDFDGDGVVDPDNTIDSFTGINPLAVGTDRRVYTTADVLIDAGKDEAEVMLAVGADALVIDRAEVAYAAAESAVMTLFAPNDVNATRYVLGGSVSGSSPGVQVGGFDVPLNVDAFTLMTLSMPNSDILSNSSAAPGFFGVSESLFTPGASAPPGAVGLTVTFAYVTLGMNPVVATFASNAVDVLIVP